MTRKSAAVAVVLLVAALGASAPAQPEADRPNAALRYWMAFAQMQDPPADEATATLLADVESGSAAWDEARLGQILHANQTALAAMRRASALARCDWGLETELGPFTPIAHLARARVLARLNTLDGIRLVALGRMDDAVDTWIAGVRFSQHLAEGGSLISVLTARVALRSAMQAMTRAAEQGALNEAQRTRIRAAITAVPETGFAWDAALRAEQAALDVWAEQLAEAPDFDRAYQQAAGTPPPPGVSLPPPAAVAMFRRVMESAARAFSLTPERTRDALPAIETATKELHPFYQLPLLSRINDSRAEVKAERERLLALLGGN